VVCLGDIGPGQEFVEPALGMAIDDAADDVGEVGVRFDADELAGLDQGRDRRPMLGSAVGAGKEGILAIQRQRADGTLDDVAVELDAPVLEEEAKAGPAREGIADRVGKLGLLADERELAAEPWLERLEQRPRALLTDRPAFVRRTSPDLVLDPV
jgi:hypothetical protein